MDKRQNDTKLSKFSKRLDNVPDETSLIESAQDTKGKFARLYLLVLSVFMAAIVALIDGNDILYDLNSAVIFMIIAVCLTLFIVAAIASSLAYLIYVQLSKLGIKVTQKEDNLFYTIKQSLKHTAFVLSLSLVSFYGSELIAILLLKQFYSQSFVFISNVICLTLFIYFFLLSLQLIINLILDMIKHAHSVVIQTSTGKRSE